MMYKMCNICNIYNKIDDISNKIDSDIEEYLNKLFEADPKMLSEFDPVLLSIIQKKLLDKAVENFTKGRNNITNFENNIYNFSLYKAGDILNQIKGIKTYYKKEEEQIQVFNNIKTEKFIIQQPVEEQQVKHMTELMKNFTSDITRGKLLTYVTEGDRKVRDEHRLLNGTTMVYNDPRWNSIMKYLEQWNCRCSIELAEKQNIIDPPSLPPFSESYSISDMDIISGRVITFSEQHPYFENNSKVLRKQYKKQDIGITDRKRRLR